MRLHMAYSPPRVRVPMTELNFFKCTNGCVDSGPPLVKVREFFEKGRTGTRSRRNLTNGHKSVIPTIDPHCNKKTVSG
jgi:hypothetical protein